MTSNKSIKNLILICILNLPFGSPLCFAFPSDFAS